MPNKNSSSSSAKVKLVSMFHAETSSRLLLGLPGSRFPIG
jgi:hypothetical protein